MLNEHLAEGVLAEWRLLERQLAAVDPASPEGERLCARAHALRDEYRQLIAEADASQRLVADPEPADGLGDSAPGADRRPIPAF